MKKQKIPLGIRLFSFNRLTIPVLLHEIESSELESRFEIQLIRNTEDLHTFVLRTGEGLLMYSFMTPHLPQICQEISQLYNIRSRNLKLVAGGAHTSGNPVSSLKAGFDYAYSGPAETGLVSFLQDFLQGELPGGAVVYQAPDVISLDRSIPDSYIFPISPPIEISRGCYWNCAFCQTSCRKTLHRSMNSFQEIYSVFKKRGHNRRINFICPSSFEYGAENPRHPDLSAIEELLRFCRAEGTDHLEFGIFPSETRPNTVTEPMLKLVTRYCTNRKLTIGAQSGSDRLLKVIRRGHSVEDVEFACDLAAKSGLQPHVDLIFGFPDENREDRRLTIDLINRLLKKYGARIHLHYFIPLSGTDMAEDIPARLDYRTIDQIDKLEKDGVCTGWWREGRKMSDAVIEVRDFLDTIDIEFTTVHPGQETAVSTRFSTESNPS